MGFWKGEHMLNNRGFTLVEVVIALAILVIISAAFIMSITGHYVWLVDTKTSITGEAFSGQETIETNVKQIKEALQELDPGDELDPDDFGSLGISNVVDEEDVKLFDDFSSEYTDREYPKVYQTEVTQGGNRKFITWVGAARIPELPVPVLEFKKLILLRDGDPGDELDNYEYYDEDKLTLYGETELDENPENCFYRNKHEWYVSNPGFLIPFPPADYIGEDELGAVYPAFPGDFEPIPIYDPLPNNSFHSTLHNYRVEMHSGRHIIYTVTPYAKSLKKGTTKWGNPVYIMGPGPMIDDLTLHLDASTEFIDYIGDPSATYDLEVWNNLRPSTGDPDDDYNAVQKDDDERPVFMSSDYGPVIPFQGEGTENEWVLGRALGNNPDNTDMASMEISEDPALDSSTSGFTLLMVMRMVPSDDPEEELDTDTPIIKGLDASGDPDNPKSWTLEWEEEDESDPVLTFKTTDKPGVDEPKPATLDKSLEINEWYIVRITIDSSPSRKSFLKAYNLHLNSEDAIDGVLEGQGKYFSINTEGIELNWNSVEIAEILLYDDVVEDVEEIIEFLIDDKYNPSY